MKIAFQGELGSNGHELCTEAFAGHEPYPCATFAEAFAAVRSGACELGLLAMENSAAGRVADVHALLPDSGLRIAGERFKRIRLYLMATPGVRIEELQRVRSHVMALAQCRRVIEALNLAPEVALDTAGAARELSEAPDRRTSAIAPKLAAGLYRLDVLREAEDDPLNTTRFIVVTAGGGEAAPPPSPTGSITSLFFSTRNVPAALFKAIGSFATNGVNLVKLESCMEGRGHFRAARFYAEIEGRPSDRQVDLARDELAFFTAEYAIAGVYAADPSRGLDPRSACGARSSPGGAARRPARFRHAGGLGGVALPAAAQHRQHRPRRDPPAGGALQDHRTGRAAQGPPRPASTDPERERQQLQRLRRLAEASDLDPAFAEMFLAFVIQEVIRHHEGAKSLARNGEP